MVGNAPIRTTVYVDDEIASASTVTAYHKDNVEHLGSVELPAIP